MRLLINRSRAERALTTGETPERIIDKMYSDRVCTELPAQK
jgi:hypothetical protein